jgi:hypothetical protein
MKNVWILVFLLFMGLVIAGCNSSRTLQFDVISEKTPFIVTSPGNQPVPTLIIIAFPDEIVPPTSVVEYSEAMLDSLKKVDFEKSFVILHQVGQIPDNGRITEIARRKDTVYITLHKYSVGPGNYELRGFTLPYQITTIEKKGKWGKEIKFILEVEGGDIVAQEQHYIP